MAGLRLTSVKKNYNATPVIHDFSIDIKDGEFIVVVGPSGCGKSTLLRMIAGLEEISSGDMYIDQKRVNQLTPKERNVAMVFQNYALYPHMRVYDNIAYGLHIRKFSKAEIKKRVQSTAELLQLEGLLDRFPRQLSGGQRQRVAMGRAIVREPTLFLFDEPLSNLDAKLRVQMRLEIKKLQQKLKVTSIYVTHDQVEAMTLADRIVVLNAGMIEQIGTPLEIYSHPASVFVAGFIGSLSMNFLTGSVNSARSSICISDHFSLPLDPNTAVAANQKVIVGIRPEHLKLEPDPHRQKITVKIKEIETLGTDTLLYSQIDEYPELFMIRISGNIEPKLGDYMDFYLPIAAIHVFDALSNKALN